MQFTPLVQKHEPQQTKFFWRVRMKQKKANKLATEHFSTM